MRAILENPDDEGPRLIYADWLDENGENGRAEFIRVQVELALMAKPHSRGAFWTLDVMREALRDDEREIALRRRERELLEEHGFDWFGEFAGRAGLDKGRGPDRDGWRYRLLGGSLSWCTFRKGFVDTLSCNLDTWNAHAVGILAAQPIDKVNLIEFAIPTSLRIKQTTEGAWEIAVRVYHTTRHYRLFDSRAGLVSQAGSSFHHALGGVAPAPLTPAASTF